MASDLDIPYPFLSKIMQQLSKSKIVSSTKGRNGGFYLSAENRKRPLVDVVICIEGDNVFKNCILGLPDCSDINPCVLHSHFKLFKNSIEQDICVSPLDKLLKHI